LAFAFALALVGCSSSGDHTVTAGESGGPAPAKNTARIRIETPAEQGPTGAVQVDPDVIEGVVDFSSGVARFNQTSSSNGHKVSMLISADGSFFESLDPHSEGPSWAHFPAEVAPSKWAPTDPKSLVTDLRTAASRVEDAGSGDVEGEATSRFTLTMPNGMSRVLWFPGSDAEPLRATIDVDKQGRLRRLATEALPGAAMATDTPSAEPGLANMTMSLWDFGVDVDASPPPAAEVVEFDEDNPDAALALLTPDRSDTGIEHDPLPEPDDSRYPANWSITSGTWESVNWAMGTGTDAQGNTCASFKRREAPEMPTFEKDAPFCFTPLDRKRPIEIVFYGVAAGVSPWFVAGATAPDLVALSLVTSDGGSVDASVYPDDHFFVVFKQTGAEVTRIAARFADGQSVQCDLTVNEPDITMSCDG